MEHWGTSYFRAVKINPLQFQKLESEFSFNWYSPVKAHGRTRHWLCTWRGTGRWTSGAPLGHTTYRFIKQHCLCIQEFITYFSKMKNPILTFFLHILYLIFQSSKNAPKNCILTKETKIIWIKKNCIQYISVDLVCANQFQKYMYCCLIPILG